MSGVLFMSVAAELAFEDIDTVRFTLSEVITMLPRVRQHSFRLVQINHSIHQLIKQLKSMGRLPQSDDFSVEEMLEDDTDECLLDRLSSLKAFLGLVRQELGEIHVMGCRVNDLEEMTVLWPAYVNGHDIYLRWCYGEKTIQSYCERGNLSEAKSLESLLDSAMAA